MTRRVLVVGRGEPERGGIPTFLSMLATSERELGCEVDFLNLSPGRPTEGGRASPANLARTATDALAVLRRARRGDIVHVHSAMAPAVTALRTGLLVAAARIRGARIVVHAHGGRVATVPVGSRAARLIGLSLRGAQMVVAVSSRVQQVLEDMGVPASRIRHVPNAIDVDLYVGPRAQHSPPRVLFVGGITARKGLLELAAASAALSGDGVEHELWVVGGVPDEGKAAEREVIPALPAGTRILGEKPPEELPGLYAEADVFCLPSWWEAMPLTVLEAQAAALPVVATDVGDVSGMVTDGVDGFVVPPRDAPALEVALRALLLDDDLRGLMGSAARTRAEAYSRRDMLGRLREIFDECWEA